MQVIGFDTETAYDADTPPRIDPVVCLTLASADPLPYPAINGSIRNGCYTDIALADDACDIWEYLLNQDVLLVAHSAAFDVCSLGFESGIWSSAFRAAEEGRIACTQVREKLLAIALDTVSFDPRLGRPPQYRLHELVKAYFGQDISASKGGDTWRTRYRLLDGLPLEYWPESAVSYAVDDAIWALLCYGALEDLTLSDTGIALVHNGRVTNEIEQTCSSIDLYLTGMHGVKVHRGRAEAFKSEYAKVLAKGLECGRALGFVRSNGTRDMKALASLIKQHIPSPELTKTGRIATNKRQMRKLEEALPAIRTYNEGKAVEKNVTTYAPKLASDYVYTRYDVLKRTGRTSGDIQQPPRVRGFRECHVAREGCVFSFCDYDSIELVCWAQLCLWWFDSSKMAELINDGKDPHLFLAAWILGDSYGVAKDKYLNKDASYYGPNSGRQLAKLTNYGLLGGMGRTTFIAHCANYGVTITDKEAENMFSGFRAAFPEAPKYFNRISYATSGRTTFTAVQARSHRQRGGVGYMDGCNTYFQGLAADGWKAAAWNLRRASVDPASPLYEVYSWLALHDESGLEGPESSAAMWSAEQERIMRESMQSYCPDVKVSCTAVISRCWSKDATAVYADGGLIPWDV